MNNKCFPSLHILLRYVLIGAQSYHYYTDWMLTQIQIKQHIIVSTFIHFNSLCAHTADCFCEQSKHKRQFIINQNKQKFHALWITAQNHNPICCEPHGKYFGCCNSQSQTLYADHQSNWHPFSLVFLFHVSPLLPGAVPVSSLTPVKSWLTK